MFFFGKNVSIFATCNKHNHYQMRIKFLSIIASFFVASLLITSCLGDDEEIEYSPNATIRMFGLDTIHGINYVFTIDQQRGLIYNEDSLPVDADTIIDKILVDTLVTASGIVTMKNKDGLDSLINIQDSMDFSKCINAPNEGEYMKMKVYAPDMQATKEYQISIRVHHYDPDVMLWTYMGDIDGNNITGEQKSVLLNGNILTYAETGGNLLVYQNRLDNKTAPADDETDTWSKSQVANQAVFGNKLPTSLIAYNGKLYATSSTEDGVVYESQDGINWSASALFGNNKVMLLLAPLKNKITFIQKKEDDGTRRFNSTKEILRHTNDEEDNLQIVPETFPVKNLSYTNYYTYTSQECVMLVGENDNAEGESLVPWGYMGDQWVALEPGNTVTDCPNLTNPSIMYYNDQFYIFGNGFESFYASGAGIAWKKAGKKFNFPNYVHDPDGDGINYPPSIENPEFRQRKNYSMIVDTENKFVYIMFSAATEKIEITGIPSFQHKSEVWRGRLNQYMFDLANAQQ